jgi:hypothetical protein
MSPVYRPDPTKVAAGIKVFDKGEYEIELGEPKPFLRETKQGKNAGQENHGVMFTNIIVEGAEKGQRYIHNCMMHTPDSETFSKQFQMAAYGFDRKDERKFDEEVGSKKDWVYDPKPEDGSDPYVGDGWRDMKGKRILISLNQRPGPNGPQQSVDGVRPA